MLAEPEETRVPSSDLLDFMDKKFNNDKVARKNIALESSMTTAMIDSQKQHQQQTPELPTTASIFHKPGKHYPHPSTLYKQYLQNKDQWYGAKESFETSIFFAVREEYLPQE
jgi:hypothetical protein